MISTYFTRICINIKKKICIKTLFEIDDFKFLLNSLIGCFSVHGETGGEIRALEPKIYNPSHTSAKITGLQPNNHYRFFVWARTSSGQGDKKTVEVLTKGIDLARRQYCNCLSLTEKLIFKLVWMKKIFPVQDWSKVWKMRMVILFSLHI